MGDRRGGLALPNGYCYGRVVVDVPQSVSKHLVIWRTHVVRIPVSRCRWGTLPLAVMALRERGRSKVIVAIGPDISTETVLAMVTVAAAPDQSIVLLNRRAFCSRRRHRRNRVHTTMSLNRRSTLQHSADSRSNIPVPTTGQKQLHGMRMSINAPVFTASGSAMKPRRSVVRSLNVNPLLQSTSKQNVGKTPLKMSVRFTRFIALLP